MQSEIAQKPISKPKIYLSALVIYLLVNFAFETLITLLENEFQQWLYPNFFLTRIGLLVIFILLTNFYMRRRAGRPKPKLWWRIVKSMILILVAYGLTMGAWLSVSEADADRARTEYENSRKELPVLVEPTLITPTITSESEEAE